MYYAGLYLKDADGAYNGIALTYFKYAAKNSPYPYNELALRELYSISSNEEKLVILDGILKKGSLSDEAREKTGAERLRILLLLDKFDEAEISLEDYFAKIGFDAETVQAFENIKIKYRRTGKENFFKITEARALLFKKEYQKSWRIFRTFIADSEKYPYMQNRAIISDAGKAALYGSSDYADDATLFEKKLNLAEQKENRSGTIETYMYAFYAARLNLKTGKKESIEAAVKLLKKAMQYAPSPADYDNALWYVLDTLKNKQFNLFLKELCESAPSWKNAYNFENFTAYTCMKLTAMGDRNGFQRFYEAIQKTNLAEAKARNSYIKARFGTAVKKEAEKLYFETYRGEHNFFYYKALAAYRLNIPLPDSLYTKKFTRSKNTDFSPDQATQVLNGLIKYKLYGKLYKTVLQIYPQITMNEAAEFSTVLAENNFYADSISLMVFAAHSKGAELSDKALQLIYPRPFLESVQKYAAEYAVPEYVLFALLRSESYFKPHVISSAGAVGLAQLMKPTAADIARRLKLENYNLHNPDTNIQFGAFYLADIIRKNGGKILPAAFAYNAGPNAVKRWQNKYGQLPTDLFLESMEYAETRGYGRNILSASVIYGTLYYGKTYSEIIKELLDE